MNVFKKKINKSVHLFSVWVVNSVLHHSTGIFVLLKAGLLDTFHFGPTSPNKSLTSIIPKVSVIVVAIRLELQLNSSDFALTTNVQRLEKKLSCDPNAYFDCDQEHILQCERTCVPFQELISFIDFKNPNELSCIIISLY